MGILPAFSSRLVLGTVQFGMPYGITNRRGQVSPETAREILSDACEAGISLVDTASGYGTSEALLGQCLPDFPSIGVVTKTAVIDAAVIGPAEIQKVRESISCSMEFLQRSRLEGLLVHNGGDLLKPGGEGLVELLMLLKSEGRIERIGVSVYDAKEIDHILEIFRPDIVQLPLNVFDQRLIQGGHIEALRSAKIEIHARSAFLQGILLANPSVLPDYFRKFDDIFAAYLEFLDNSKLSPLSACLGFMIQQSGVDRVIVGVTARSELAEILAALPTGPSMPPMHMLASNAPGLVDPREWPSRDILGMMKQ